MTWFQAQVACRNSRKRLPSNAEWQAAVIGTPDPGSDNGTTDCNTTAAIGWPEDPVATGSRSTCVSSGGAFDMVGNREEFVADWLPRSTDCSAWQGAVSPTGDQQCLVGAATAGEPGVLLRGGSFNFVSTSAGPLTVYGLHGPSIWGGEIGFRCAVG